MGPMMAPWIFLSRKVPSENLTHQTAERTACSETTCCQLNMPVKYFYLLNHCMYHITCSDFLWNNCMEWVLNKPSGSEIAKPLMFKFIWVEYVVTVFSLLIVYPVTTCILWTTSYTLSLFHCWSILDEFESQNRLLFEQFHLVIIMFYIYIYNIWVAILPFTK